MRTIKINTRIRASLFALSLVAASVTVSGAAAQEVAAAPAERQTDRARPARRGDREHLTMEEIAERTESDAFSLIYAARPTWLRSRGQVSMYRNAQVQVYVSGMRQSGAQTLRQIQTSAIAHIEHLDGATATQRFGVDHGAGAILVTLK